jgi:protein TonB
MGRTAATAVILAAVVNAGVLLALPLLGGALETAMPSQAVYELHEVEVVKRTEPREIPLPRRAPERHETKVEQVREKPVPEQEPAAESPVFPPAEAAPDWLRLADIDIDPQEFAPDVELFLPGVAGTHGVESAGRHTTAPVEKIRSLNEVDRLPVRLQHVEPVYPSWALEQEIEGSVTLALVIGADGGVSDVVVEESSGYADLDRSAAAAVRLWRFAPALSGGKAVAVRATQRIRFSLR